MSKFDEDLGKALRECREQRGYTQQRVAEYFGVSKMTVSYWESGKHAMKAEDLKRYCKLLDVTAQSILDRT